MTTALHWKATRIRLDVTRLALTWLQLVDDVAVELLVGDVLELGAHEVRMDTPQDSQVAHDQNRSALSLQLDDDWSDALDHVQVGLAADCGARPSWQDESRTG